MKLTLKPTKMLVIEDLDGSHVRLDPIRVITENMAPGQGRIIIITCYDAAWVGYWGAMSGKSVEQFFIDCDAEYLAGNLGCASSLSRSNGNRNYLIRVIRAVQDALRKRQPKRTTASEKRHERLKHANELIRVISQHGRRFFWNATAQRVARMERLDAALTEWIDKTDWVRKTVQAPELGVHLADVMSARLKATLAHDRAAELVEHILQDDIHNRLTPRVVDIAYSAWHIGRSGKNKDDGGPCDWFNDTKPMVMEQLAKIKKDLAEESAPAQQPPPPTVQRLPSDDTEGGDIV